MVSTRSYVCDGTISLILLNIVDVQSVKYRLTIQFEEVCVVIWANVICRGPTLIAWSEACSGANDST